jgi:hypothetical protein
MIPVVFVSAAGNAITGALFLDSSNALIKSCYSFGQSSAHDEFWWMKYVGQQTISAKSCEAIIHALKCGMTLSARKDEIDEHIHNVCE